MNRDAESRNKSLSEIAMGGVFWSLIQSWTARGFTFITFIIIANVLNPEQYGLASVAITCSALIATFADLGYADAIVQRRDFKDGDANAPFMISLIISCGSAAVLWGLSGWLAKLIHQPQSEPLIRAIAFLPPIVTMASFQEANYKKKFKFRALAFRVVISSIVSAPVAIVGAYRGLGAGSLVLQAYATGIIGLVWLWAKPLWRPSAQFDWRSAKELTKFGAPIASMRLVDFFALRFVDAIIVYKFGPMALGLYAAGSRIYQTLMQVLQAGLGDVSLAILSTISDDKQRMGTIYRNATGFASIFGSPIFVMMAAISPELCAVLFRQSWAGVEKVTAPLLIVGAVQCVQFLNGSYLSARGKSSTTFVIGMVKYIVIIVGLVSFRFETAIETVTLFAFLQLASTPLTFAAVARELDIKISDLVLLFHSPVFSMAAGGLAVHVARPVLAAAAGNPIATGAGLAMVFCLTYAVAMLLIGRRQLNAALDFAMDKFGRRFLARWAK